MRFLAGLGGMRLDDRVAADGVGDGAADAAVLRVGEAVGGRHVERREGDVAGHERRRADQGGEAEPGLEQRQRDRGADQRDQRREQRQQEGVVELVERPAAAGDAAHGRAGERVGVPVGRQPLHPREPCAQDA